MPRSSTEQILDGRDCVGQCRVNGCERPPTHRCPTALDSNVLECSYHMLAMHNDTAGTHNEYLLTPITNTEENDMTTIDLVTPHNVVLNRDPDPILTEEALRGVKTGEWLIRKDGTLFQVTEGAREAYTNQWVLKLNNSYGDYVYNLRDLAPGGYNGDVRRIAARHDKVTAALRARTINKLTSEMEAFKQQIVAVAREYGTRHNMCSVLAEALSELGLEITNRKRVTVTVEVDAEWGEDASTSDIQEALSNGDWYEVDQEDVDSE